VQNSTSDDPTFDTIEDFMRLREWPEEHDTDPSGTRDVRVPRVLFGLLSPELKGAMKELARVPVRRVMDPDFARIHIGANGEEMRELFASGIRSAIVVDDVSRPIGVVTAAGVVRAEVGGKPLQALRVHDAASLGVAKLAPDSALADALAQMAASPDLPLAVVRADGTLAGGFESHHVVAWLGAGVVAGS
jgi:hypothetical protein